MQSAQLHPHNLELGASVFGFAALPRVQGVTTWYLCCSLPVRCAVVLRGACGVQVGMGATLLDGVAMEPGSIVAAGAVVPPGAAHHTGKSTQGYQHIQQTNT